MGSSTPAQYFARDARPNQLVYNPQQYVPPPPVQQAPTDPMAMLKLLLDEQRASKKTMEYLANRMENLREKILSLLNQLLILEVFFLGPIHLKPIMFKIRES